MKRHLTVMALLLPLLVVAQTYHTDTIGGTTYDWAANGPVLRMVANDTGGSTPGVHALWMFSATTGNTSFPDRNMRYNFWDRSIQQWAFNTGGNYMDFGVNCFSSRSGYGALDVNTNSHCAYVSGHIGLTGNINTFCVRDAAPGSGTFEQSDSMAHYQWPAMSMSGDEKIHMAFIDDASQNQLWYSRIDPWNTWSTPVHIATNDPEFPTQQIAASSSSSNLIVTWVVAPDGGTPPYDAFYQLSSDGGQNWNGEMMFDKPPAYTPGSETLVSYHIAGNAVLWDNADQWHFAANVMCVTDQGYTIPAEIWHFNPAADPQWTRIHRYSLPETLVAPVGYNAMFACRPSLATDRDNNLYCVWEQFDSLNAEVITSRARADIFGAASTDNGVTWGPAVKLTASDATSHRFPSVAQVVGDDLHIVYIDDLQAGFFVQGEAGATADNNPVVYLRVPRDSLLHSNAVVESPATRHVFVPTLAVSPNPFGRSTMISYEMPRAANAALRIYDASGHLVRTLASGVLSAGRGSALWDGTNAAHQAVARGIYFARLETPNRTLSQKVVFSR